MASLRIASLAALALFLAAGAARAEMAQDSYCARISENDKVASDGFMLTDAASIIRQDRANFHKFGLRDREDDGDGTFASPSARARIPALLDRGDSSNATLRRIVRGTPRVCVFVYSRSMLVELD